jgi:ABC-type sugar transport system permease subunit
MPPLTPLRRKEALSAYLFISPFLIWLVFLMGGPILAAFFLSFCSWDLIGELKFVGMANFNEMFGFEKLTKLGDLVTQGPVTMNSVTVGSQTYNLGSPAVFQEPTSLVILQDQAQNVMVQSAITFKGFGAFMLGAFDWTLIPNDPRFWSAFYNTAYLTLLSVPIGMVLSIAVALLMNQKIKGIEVFRAVYYLPSVLGDRRRHGGPLEVDLQRRFRPLELLLVPDLGDPHPGMPEVAGQRGLVQTGPHHHGFLERWRRHDHLPRRVTGHPQTHYEAAEIDGANRWQQFLAVTLPGLSPVIFFNLIISIVSSFQIFNQVYVITDGLGGPADSTLVLVLYVYQEGVQVLPIRLRLGAGLRPVRRDHVGHLGAVQVFQVGVLRGRTQEVIRLFHADDVKDREPTLRGFVRMQG